MGFVNQYTITKFGTTIAEDSHLPILYLYLDGSSWIWVSWFWF